MKTSISFIVNKGNLDREAAVFRAKTSVNIGDYLVLQTGSDDEGVNNDTFHSFWFPDKQVLGGEYIVLWTKQGNTREVNSKEHGKLHYFYWGLKESIWEHTDRALVFLHAPEWESETNQSGDE